MANLFVNQLTTSLDHTLQLRQATYRLDEANDCEAIAKANLTFVHNLLSPGSHVEQHELLGSRFKTYDQEKSSSAKKSGIKDFQFVWGDDHKAYPSFTKSIEQTHLEGEVFGPEGDITETYHWQREVVSYSELKEKLTTAAKCVNLTTSQGLVKQAETSMLEDILGKQQNYNVQESLSYLRSLKEKTPEQKLLQRTLSLISYDSLSRESVARHDLQQIYDDLNFTDPTILPDGRKSGAVNFISFCLYQDEHRRIRMHFTTPSHSETAEFPHNHYGPSGSIILSGSLVNQFLAVFPAKDKADADFALYGLQKEGFTEEARRGKKQSSFLTDVKLGIASSHLYQRGDHYLLPEPREIKGDISINDKLTFHRIGTRDHSITLFSQELTSMGSHTTYPVGSPPIINKEYNEATLPRLEALTVAKKIDQMARSLFETI